MGFTRRRMMTPPTSTQAPRRSDSTTPPPLRPRGAAAHTRAANIIIETRAQPGPRATTTSGIVATVDGARGDQRPRQHQQRQRETLSVKTRSAALLVHQLHRDHGGDDPPCVRLTRPRDVGGDPHTRYDNYTTSTPTTSNAQLRGPSRSATSTTSTSWTRTRL